MSCTNTIKCYFGALQFEIYSWFISLCSFISHVKVIAWYDKMVWYGKLYTLVKENDSTCVTVIYKNNKNLF